MTKDYRYLKKHLPDDIFKPNRLFLLPLIGTALAGWACVGVIGLTELPWYLNLCLSLLIGYCWSVGGLFGHELLHGAIVRSKKWQNIIGFFCFLPYLISPTFWRYWHNKLHHSYTQKIIMDPDAFPTLKIYRQSKFIQWMFPFTPGSGKKRSFFYLFFWFSFNAQIAQHYFRYRNKIFNKLNHKRVNVEMVLALLIHASVLVWLGPSQWFWAVIIPFVVMNYIPFSYISTNHNLSPLTKRNDPLSNSLTVTNHPVLEALHINFGYHVEHHLFPTISGAHLKKVHYLLKNEFPSKYQFMPKWRAIRALYQTSRIYKNSMTLVNPYSGKTFGTLVEAEGVKTEAPRDYKSPKTEFNNSRDVEI